MPFIRSDFRHAHKYRVGAIEEVQDDEGTLRTNYGKGFPESEHQATENPCETSIEKAVRNHSGSAERKDLMS